ncbi:MAG: prolyl oligopeptidase family serine peptidase [Acidobacteriota bacterium]
MLDLWLMGGAGATARGYDCLAFDGPGQGYALWETEPALPAQIGEKVITPVVDYALSRPGVDPKRIVLQGISQGGYWVPRALAFEKRIAAGIADPGVIDVSTSWVRTLPQPLLELLKAGRKAEFDGYMAQASPANKALMNFRMRPFGFASAYDTYKATLEYNLTGVVGQIRCPLLITSPANEAFWPGQPRQLFDLVTSPKKLVEFSESDGADLHCEPNGLGIRDLRIFNWLDETLA